MSAYLGEAQLLGWSESHNAGAKMTLALPDPSDLTPFRSMTVKKGKQAGQILACLIVEMNDGEDPLAALQRALTSNIPMSMLPPKEVGGPLSILAGKWCKSEGFQNWFLLHGDIDHFGGGSLEEVAARKIRAMCGVKSRAEIDHNDRAKAVFNEQIRAPFRKRLEEQDVWEPIT